MLCRALPSFNELRTSFTVLDRYWTSFTLLNEFGRASTSFNEFAWALRWPVVGGTSAADVDFEGVPVVQWRCLVLCVYCIGPLSKLFLGRKPTFSRKTTLISYKKKSLFFSLVEQLDETVYLLTAKTTWHKMKVECYYESFSDNQCSIVMNLRQSRYHGTFDVLIIGSVYTWLLWAYLSRVVTGCAIWFDNHGEHTFCMLLVFYICWLYRCFIVVT